MVQITPLDLKCSLKKLELVQKSDHSIRHWQRGYVSLSNIQAVQFLEFYCTIQTHLLQNSCKSQVFKLMQRKSCSPHTSELDRVIMCIRLSCQLLYSVISVSPGPSARLKSFDFGSFRRYVQSDSRRVHAKTYGSQTLDGLQFPALWQGKSPGFPAVHEPQNTAGSSFHCSLKTEHPSASSGVPNM